MIKITRRQFLKISAAGVAALGFPIQAFSSTRKPYVNAGEVVSHIGRAPGGFIGAKAVKEVKKWDGMGYPVILRTDTFPSGTKTYYDFDLADLNREIPDRFWHNPQNRSKYNNVHTYLRTKRFGETRKQAVRHLNYSGPKNGC